MILVFNIFSSILALIALFIAFFLLLISMTQNVTEALWEYGVLRSMGITLKEGHRIYQYEAFMIIISAAILGTTVGICVSLLMSAQLLMFLELPTTLPFPWVVYGIMMSVAIVTTYVSVYLPMSKVNKSTISATIKGSS